MALERYTARLLAAFPTDELKREFQNIQRAIAFPSFIRGLLDDESASAARTTLGLGTAAVEGYTSASFSPGIAFGGAAVGVTYGNQLGHSVRIGNMVFASFRLTLTSNGTSTGVVTITGLPVAVWNNGRANSPGVVKYANLSGLTDGVVALAVENTTTASLWFGGAASMTQLTEANVTDTADMYVSLTYFAGA